LTRFIFLRKPYFNLGFAKTFHHFWRRCAIGEEGIDLLKASQTDQGIAPELGMIGNQIDGSGILDDRLGDPHFPVVEVEQRAIGIYTADADDPDVHLELPNQIDGGLTDNSAVATADKSTGNYHLVAWVIAESSSHVQVVGDDA